MKFELIENKYLIQPGYLIFHKTPIVIYGVAGSAVFFALWDKEKKQVGCCTYLLPNNHENKKKSAIYGNIALSHIYNLMKQEGSNPNDIQAYIIGGAIHNEVTIAQQNIKIAEHFCKKNAIEIISQDTGGRLGRKFILDTSTGNHVLYKTIHLRSCDWYPYQGIS